MDLRYLSNFTNKFQGSCNQMLEAIDNGSVGLILEANAEFVKSANALKQQAEELASMLNGASGKLSTIAGQINGAGLIIGDLDFDKIPEEYSFTDHYKMMNVTGDDEGDDVALSTMGFTAAFLSRIVNGLKDAVIVVAKWFESEPELFSVGKNGVVVNPKFLALRQGNDDITLSTFAQSGTEILGAFSGKSDEDEIKNHFQSLWKKPDMTEEEEESAWEDFVGRFDKLSQNAQAAHDEATKAIVNAQPDASVQQEVPGKSILGSLLGAMGGGGSDWEYTIDQGTASEALGENVKSPSQGLFALTFEELQSVIAGLLSMSDSANAAAAQALAGAQSATSEAMKPDPAQAALAEKIISVAKDKELASKVGVALEESGMGKDADLSKVDVTKFKEALSGLKFDEAQINAVLEALEMTPADDEETAEPEENIDPPSVWDNDFNAALMNISKHKEGAMMSDVTDLFRDTNLLDDEQNPKSDITEKNQELAQVLDKIKTSFNIEDDEVIDKFKEVFLVNSEKATEKNKGTNETFHRWGKLAGIIKG